MQNQISAAISGLPRSMPNANQCRSKLWQWSRCWSIQINADINSDKCQIKQNWSGIDWHWQFLLIFCWCLDSALIGIDRHWGALWINAMILIGIDRHLALIEGVLQYTRYEIMDCPWFWVFFKYHLQKNILQLTIYTQFQWWCRKRLS